MEVVRGNKLPD